MSLAIGIDLGTTNTVVAAVVDGIAVTLQDEQGRRLLPSVVSFHPSGTVLVGEAARERHLVDPENTIFSVKPLLGRAFDAPEVTRARQRFPFALHEGSKNSVAIAARGKDYSLPEISAFVLSRAKAIAERALGRAVTRAVITVPANFNELQRASTKIAGKLAGLEVLRILNEPTAAALAYGQSLKTSEKVAVYDLGGGTFDITLLDLAGKVFEVLSTAGDTALGGDDIDRALADALATDVLVRFGFDPRTSPSAMGRLRFLAEEIKKDLSTQPESFRTLEGIGQGAAGAPIQMSLRVARTDLERFARPLVDRTLEVTRRSLEAAGLSPTDIARVIMVGGSTRMPLVVRAVTAYFGKPPHLDVNPDEVVALGAAIQAHTLAPAKKPAPPPVPTGPMRPRAETSPGIGGPPERAPNPPAFFEFARAAPVLSFSVPPPRIQGASPMDFLFEIETKEGSASRPIDEAFARGSAVRTATLPPLLIDVTPHSLRVETVGGYSDVLIHANSPVPCEKARTFLTATDRQTTVTVRVAQGESPRFGENTYLGELELSGLPPAPRGAVKIVVTFELDASGTLDVRARDEASGRETKAQMRLLATPNDVSDIDAIRRSFS